MSDNNSGAFEGVLKYGNMFVLNLLWLLFCIPVVTAGASTTALCTMMIKMTKNEEPPTFKGFMKFFKANFKKSTIAWLIVLAFSAMIYMHYYFVKNVAEGALKAYAGLVGVELVALALFLAFLFPIIGRYENTVFNSFKNSFLLAVSHFTVWLKTVILWLIPVVITVMFPEWLMFTCIFWIFFGGGLISWLTARSIRRMFDKMENIAEEKVADKKEEAAKARRMKIIEEANKKRI